MGWSEYLLTRYSLTQIIYGYTRTKRKTSTMQIDLEATFHSPTHRPLEIAANSAMDREEFAFAFARFHPRKIWVEFL